MSVDLLSSANIHSRSSASRTRLAVLARTKGEEEKMEMENKTRKRPKRPLPFATRAASRASRASSQGAHHQEAHYFAPFTNRPQASERASKYFSQVAAVAAAEEFRFRRQLKFKLTTDDDDECLAVAFHMEGGETLFSLLLLLLLSCGASFPPPPRPCSRNNNNNRWVSCARSLPRSRLFLSRNRTDISSHRQAAGDES